MATEITRRIVQNVRTAACGRWNAATLAHGWNEHELARASALSLGTVKKCTRWTVPGSVPAHDAEPIELGTLVQLAYALRVRWEDLRDMEPDAFGAKYPPDAAPMPWWRRLLRAIKRAIKRARVDRRATA